MLIMLNKTECADGPADLTSATTICRRRALPNHTRHPTTQLVIQKKACDSLAAHCLVTAPQCQVSSAREFVRKLLPPLAHPHKTRRRALPSAGAGLCQVVQAQGSAKCSGFGSPSRLKPSPA